MDATRLKQSWNLVTSHGDQVPLYFYSTLFLTHPDVREMVPTTMAGQRDRLVTALGHIVSNVDRIDQISGFVQGSRRRSPQVRRPAGALSGCR
ncbi:hypothetical protein [Plantactinospora sp. GCM10030261]|uniref:hypothetical protein n=1 Tax=Plantactinospora sp. GCM10030261 TaxID=3273420 RepID=UPI0036084279